MPGAAGSCREDEEPQDQKEVFFDLERQVRNCAPARTRSRGMGNRNPRVNTCGNMGVYEWGVGDIRC